MDLSRRNHPCVCLLFALFIYARFRCFGLIGARWIDSWIEIVFLGNLYFETKTRLNSSLNSSKTMTECLESRWFGFDDRVSKI